MALTARPRSARRSCGTRSPRILALPRRPPVIVGGRIADMTDLSASGADWVGTSLVDVRAYAADPRGAPGPGRRRAAEPRQRPQLTIERGSISMTTGSPRDAIRSAVRRRIPIRLVAAHLQLADRPVALAPLRTVDERRGPAHQDAALSSQVAVDLEAGPPRTAQVLDLVVCRVRADQEPRRRPTRTRPARRAGRPPHRWCPGGPGWARRGTPRARRHRPPSR